MQLILFLQEAVLLEGEFTVVFGQVDAWEVGLQSLRRGSVVFSLPRASLPSIPTAVLETA